MTEARPWDWDKVASEAWSRPDPAFISIAERWARKGYARFLDLGCGIGRHALAMARYGFEVTGLDLSARGLEKLAALAGAEGFAIGTVLGQARALPFADRSFDCVLAFQSIYHCDGPSMAETIAEVARVLEPGGEFYGTFIARENAYFEGGRGRTEDPRVRMKLEEDGSLLPHFYAGEADIKRLLAGFFEIMDIGLERESGEAGKSRHYRVLASRKFLPPPNRRP